MEETAWSVKPCTQLGNGGNSVVSETMHRVGEWRKQRGQLDHAQSWGMEETAWSVKPCTELGNGGNRVVSETMHIVGE